MTRSARNFNDESTDNLGPKKGLVQADLDLKGPSTSLLEANRQEIEITSMIKKDVDRTLPELHLF